MLTRNFYVREADCKEAAFKVKIIELKGDNVPELDDDFAKTVGPNIDSLEALKERI